MSVVIGGPAILAPGATGGYTVTSTKASLGTGSKMGVNIASTEGGATLAESAANLVVSGGEIVHSQSAGVLNTTDNGVASYSFNYTMPAAASLGSTHTLYAVSRLGFAGGWKHASDYPVTAATAPGAPIIGGATPGINQAMIAFSAPASNGGLTISSYTATCSAGGQTTRSNIGGTSPITVAALTANVTYSCAVTATNAAGTSGSSGAVGVTPLAPGVAPQITSAAGTSFNVLAMGSFNVTATGTPAPAFSLSGTLPSGVTFSGAGVLSGTPASGTANSYPLTITAANGTLPNATQNFTLTVARLNQNITFGGPGGQNFSATPVPLSATADSGLTVSFTSATPSVCSVAGTAATLIAAGTCSVTASQSGDANYFPASTITRGFSVTAVAPGAPVIGIATPGNLQAIIAFTPPTFSGGAAISGYTVTCNPGMIPASGATSPITVTGLSNGVSYTCSVRAANSAGAGAESATVPVTPTSASVAPVFTSANSMTIPLGVTDAMFITAFGTPYPTLSLADTLPAGMSFTISPGTVNPVTGILGGTPAPGSAGTYPLTFKAVNGTLPNASQSFTLTVLKRSQTINAVAPPSPQTFTASPVPLSAGASSGLPVTFTSDTPWICTVSGSGAIMVSSGTCMVSVSQAGNNDFHPAANASIAFSFQPASQTLSFPAQIPATRAFVPGGTFTLNPLATSSSGMPVGYSTFGNFPCSVNSTPSGATNGATVTMVAPGACQIQADQFGDSRFFAAPQVSQTILLQAGPPGPPLISGFTTGDGLVTINLATPTNDGGNAINTHTATCTPGPFVQAQGYFSGTPSPISIFGLTNGTAYTCTATATNFFGDSPPSAPITVTPGVTVLGQNLYQNNCSSCHFGLGGAMLNAAGSTGNVVAYARTNVFQMSNDFNLFQLTAADLAAIAAYIQAQLPPIAPSTTTDTPVSIDVGSHITLNTVSFNAIEVVGGPASGTLTPTFGTGFTYTPNAGFAGIDSFSYRGVRNDFQPPLTGEARTVNINVIGPSYSLAVSNFSGSGSGRVSGPGIDCGFDCNETYSGGTLVTLSAQPDFGYIFTGWSGDCMGSGTCSVTMDANKNVNALFAIGYAVTPSAGANGSISPATPVGLLPGQAASFSISADAGYTASVGGTCGGAMSGNVYTTYPVYGNCTVNAIFLRDPVVFNVVLEGAQALPLNLLPASGTATVNVNRDAKTISYSMNFSGLSGAFTDIYFQGPANRGAVGPAKYNASANQNFGSFSYNPADEAELLAGRWYINIYTGAYVQGEIRGQLDGQGAVPRHLITVNMAGAAAGTVTSSVGGINCGLNCTFNAPQNLFIALAAAPNAGAVFAGWSGGGCSGTGACNVIAMVPVTVTATFSAAPTSFTVTPSAGPNGVIMPSTPQTVAPGGSTSFIITPNAGYGTSVGGSCPGSQSGNTFTAGPVTAHCTVDATFALLPLSLQSVVSVKTHTAIGERELSIATGVPVTGAVTIEPRAIGTGHRIVFRFGSPVFGVNLVEARNAGGNLIGSATPSFPGNNELVVTLTGVPDNQRVAVTAAGVNGGALTVPVAIGFLVGDVTNNHAVNAADISAVKARIGKTVSIGNNHLFDLDANNVINNADVSAAKARAGKRVP